MADDEADSGRPDAAALHAALSGGSEEARDYLRKQSRLADLQIADLEREDALRHWSLRVRHISDVIKVMFEVTAVLIALAIIVTIGAAIWSAAHDDSVVIDAFRMPADIAQRGLSGDVVASQFLDRLAQLQAQTDSSRAPGTYASDWGNDIKVAIPNTGISIGEAYRYLAGWLGHQTHISGEVWHTENGIALTIRTNTNSSLKLEGRERDLGALLMRAAESVYGQTQPYRYAVYLMIHGRGAESEKILRGLTADGPDSEKPWAYTLWSFSATGAETLRRAREAVALAPDLPLATNNLADLEAWAGHDERELQMSRATKRSLSGHGVTLVIPRAAAATAVQSDANIAEELGDFSSAVAAYERLASAPDFEGSRAVARIMGAADAAIGHDVARSRRLLEANRDVNQVAHAVIGYGWQVPNFRFAQFEQFAAIGDWKSARTDIEAAVATPEAKSIAEKTFIPAQVWPYLALAQAKAGDLKVALATIDKTPLDCYLCLRMRGQIAAMGHDWNTANGWFAKAAEAAPSIPFAYSEWGAMLMAKGDLDGAIAKFTIANQKGPHFADPLEMWGEVLIVENRSDLALAKFEEAAKCAANWKRLHQKWGEALSYLGRKDEAAKQFA
jgi:tetratricopeptide (TPR) repeat protein